MNGALLLPRLMTLMAAISIPSGQNDSVPPTFAQSAAAQVRPGQSVIIELDTRPRRPGTRFFIRSQPGFGQVGEPRVLPDGRAQVEYFLPGNAPRMEVERFAFSAQNPGATMSAPAAVTISIVRLPATLEAVKELDFGRLFAGESALQKLRISNPGDDPYLGKVRIDPPWSIAGDPSSISLPGGASTEWTLEIESEEAGDPRGWLHFEGPNSVGVQLSATIVDPLALHPPVLQLERLAGPLPLRAASLTISNKREEEVVADFQVPAFLEEIAPLPLAPGESRTVRIMAGPELPLAAEGILTLTTAFDRRNLTVHSPALPARLVLESPGVADFGQAENFTNTTRQVLIRNTGGSNARVQVTGPMWMHVSPGGVEIPPGAVVEFTFSPAASIPDGPFRSFVRFNSGPERLEIEVAGDKLSLYQGSAGAPVPAVSELTAVGSSQVVRPAAEIPLPLDPPLEVLEAGESGKKIFLVWRDPSSLPRNYQFHRESITSRSALVRDQIARELDQLGRKRMRPETYHEYIRRYEEAKNDDAVLSQWIPVEPLEIRNPEPGVYSALIRKPTQTSRISLRITPVSTAGEPSPVRTLIRIPLVYDPDSMRFLSDPKAWAWIVFAAAASALGFRFLRRFIRREPAITVS